MFCSVFVEVCEIIIVLNGLIIDRKSYVITQRGCKCRFAGTDEAGDTDKEILEL